MDNWQKNSWLPLFCMAVIAACIFIYITHYPPIPPANYLPEDGDAAIDVYVPQDSLLLAKVLSVVRFGYPLVGSILIVWIISNPFALQKRVRDLHRLKAERRGQTPRDGSVIAVAGPIIADHGPVTTPAGRTNCIAYEYYVAYELDRGAGNGYYYGYAFTPSSIDASFGKVKILAVPDIDLFSIRETAYTDSTALNNFKTYLRGTMFVESLIGWPPFSKERNMSMTDRMSPVRGDVKMKLRRPDPDLDGCKVVEKCLDQGENVCAFGMYSASQQGLVVQNPGAGDLCSIQIKRGPITKFIREQKSSIVRNLAGTICTLAMLMVIVWTYHNFYYTYDTLYNLSQYGK